MPSQELLIPISKDHWKGNFFRRKSLVAFEKRIYTCRICTMSPSCFPDLSLIASMLLLRMTTTKREWLCWTKSSLSVTPRIGRVQTGRGHWIWLHSSLNSSLECMGSQSIWNRQSTSPVPCSMGLLLKILYVLGSSKRSLASRDSASITSVSQRRFKTRSPILPNLQTFHHTVL